MIIPSLFYKKFKFNKVIKMHAIQSSNLNIICYPCARIVLTGQRQHLQVSHRAQMLQPEVAHLRAPAQEQGGQRQHRGDVADADVGDVHTTAGAIRESQIHNYECHEWDSGFIQVTD